MTTTQVQQKKVFSCFTCKADVHLVRNQEAQKWDKYDLNGTPHVCSSKKKQQQQQQPPQMDKRAEAIALLHRAIKLLTEENETAAAPAKK